MWTVAVPCSQGSGHHDAGRCIIDNLAPAPDNNPPADTPAGNVAVAKAKPILSTQEVMFS